MTDILELARPDLFHARVRGDGSVETEGPGERLIGRQVRHPREGDRPDGVWVRWVWRDGTLTVTNDRHGYLPLYYMATGDEVCVSPSLMDVVRRTGRRIWNPLALGLFVRIGSFLGDETLFRDVRLLPPNGTLTWRPGNPKVTASRRPVAAEPLERDAAMDGFIDLVRVAVRRRLPRDGEPAWIPLSGGRDSRHLLFELHLAGVRPRCLSVRYRPPGLAEDANVAGAVCAALGLDHEVLDVPPDWLTLERRKNLLLGFTSAAHYWFLPLAERMTAGGGVAYDGIGGDILSSGHTIFPDIMAHFEAGRYEAIARGWFDPGNERFLRRFLRRDVLAAMPLEAAVARVTEELAAHSAMPNPIASYHMEARTRHGITVTQYGYLRRLNAVLSPYLDVELYDYLSAIPWRLFADQRFHSDAIARAFPRFNHVRYAVKGATEARGAEAEFRRMARQMLAYLAVSPTSAVIKLPYLSALTLRSFLQGSSVTMLPLFLLQLERDGGIELQ